MRRNDLFAHNACVDIAYVCLCLICFTVRVYLGACRFALIFLRACFVCRFALNSARFNFLPKLLKIIIQKLYIYIYLNI